MKLKIEELENLSIDDLLDIKIKNKNLQIITDNPKNITNVMDFVSFKNPGKYLESFQVQDLLNFQLSDKDSERLKNIMNVEDIKRINIQTKLQLEAMMSEDKSIFENPNSNETYNKLLNFATKEELDILYYPLTYIANVINSYKPKSVQELCFILLVVTKHLVISREIQ